jgi:hypothetical protein
MKSRRQPLTITDDNDFCGPGHLKLANGNACDKRAANEILLCNHVTIPDGDALRGLKHEGVGGYPGGQVGGVDVGHSVGQLAPHLLQVAGRQGQAYVGLTKPTQGM